MSEDFRAFYKRTTGVTWPGQANEAMDTVLARMADALADWADIIAAPKAVPEIPDAPSTMSKSHTQGPLEVLPVGNTIIVSGGPNNDEIAEFFSRDEYAVKTTPQEALANAHLFTAAGGLLAALKDILEPWDGPFGSVRLSTFFGMEHPMQARILAALAAIARATQSPSWPKYESHKVVQAAKIVDFDMRDTGGRICAIVDPGNGKTETFVPTAREMLDRAEVGGWAMLYPDGFKSISPAKAFEEGYTRCID